MADDEIEITEKERKRLETGEEYTFPEYARPVLNAAMNTANANQKHTVGKTSGIREEFNEEYPEGTHDDWVRFYNDEYDGEHIEHTHKDGEERVTEAIEKTYEMLQNFQEVIDELNEEEVRDYVHEFIYYKTPQGFADEEVILQKLSDIYELEYTKDVSDEADDIDGRLGEQEVSIKPESFRRQGNPDAIDAPLVYYKEFKTTDKLELDISELNNVLCDED